MMNYIKLGEKAPIGKEVVKSRCLGSFDMFWDEIKRNHSNNKNLKGFDKNDWRSAYDRALHFDGLNDIHTSDPSLNELDIIAKKFLLGLSYKEWIKHFDREGFNRSKYTPDLDIDTVKITVQNDM